MASNKRAAQGAGNIRKHVVMRDGQSYTYWEARVTVGTDAVTGKPVRRSFSGKTQKEVREKMQAAAVAVNDGDYFEPSKMTLARWLDIWLSEYTGDKKFLTVKHYKAQAKTHIKPSLGTVKLSELKPPQIQAFYNELMRSGHKVPKYDEDGKIVKKDGKTVYEQIPMSAKSVRNIHGVLTKALSTAVKVGYLKSNPAALVTLPKVQKKEIHPLTDEQVKAFLKEEK